MQKLVNENSLKAFPVNNVPPELSKECVINLYSLDSNQPLRLLRSEKDGPTPVGFFNPKISDVCTLKWIPIGLDYGIFKVCVNDDFDQWLGVHSKGSNGCELYPQVYCCRDSTMHSLWQIKTDNKSQGFSLRCPSLGGFLRVRNEKLELYAGFYGSSSWAAKKPK